MDRFINGARWWKFDFHCHTPKSFDYKTGDKVGDEPREWLKIHMMKEIDCIAITDHNTGSYIDVIKDAYEQIKLESPEWFRETYIFPGVEITVNGGIHALAIFDTSKTSEDITRIIGECGYEGTLGNSDGVTSSTLENIIEMINRKKGVLIPAHVDKNAGLFATHRGTTLEQILKNNRDNLLTLELMDKNYEFPEIYKKSKLNLSRVIGSDSHGIDEIGRYYTWIKMSKPSMEALKLALHDGEDSVIRHDEIENNPNSIIDRYFIKNLEVSRGYKVGNDFPLESKFSPWLTSIIGGRGSGKSAIINYLRIVLDRVSEMPTDVQSDFDKFNRIGSKDKPGMLRDKTSIVVEIYKDSKLHRIQWSNGLFKLMIWNKSTSNWSEPTEITNIKELFPVQIFSQKELYELTNDPKKLLEIIDSQFDKSSWIDNRKELVSKWLNKRSEKRKIKNLIDEEDNLRTELVSVQNRIEFLENMNQNEVLRRFSELSKTKDYLDGLIESIDNFSTKVIDMKNSLPDLDLSESVELQLDEETKAYISKIAVAMDSSEIIINELVNHINPYSIDLKMKLNSLPWYNNYLDAKMEYEKINNQIQDIGDKSYEDLLKRRNLLTKRTKEIESKKETLEMLDKELKVLNDDIVSLEMELREKRKVVLENWYSITDGDKPILTVELDPMGDEESANETFRTLIRKEGSEYSNHIYKVDENNNQRAGIIGKIIDSNYEDRCDVRKMEIEGFVEAIFDDSKKMDTRLRKHLKTIMEDTPEDIDRLLVWFPEDKINLKLDKEGKSINIEKGSAGERTAAMLGLLLSLNSIPLIIDQPEDDLDTRLISNFVVTGFKSLKKKKQLIIVTHNPNIAVNSNSDNIIHMNYTTGQIKVASNDALQDIKIRNAVCEVMEGGKEALDKRYYRISKALK